MRRSPNIRLMASQISTAHDKKNKIISVRKIVRASPDQIFDLLANPAMHVAIDGSGSLVASQSSKPQRLSLNATFGMRMKMGIPYTMTNKVVEFEEGKQIAWRHLGGHVWRYILEPVTGGTLVTEQFSYGTARSPLMLKLVGLVRNKERDITKTLDNLADYFENKK